MIDSMAMGQVRDSVILKVERAGRTCFPTPHMPAGSFTSSYSKKLARKKVLNSFSTPGRHMSQEEASTAVEWLQGRGRRDPSTDAQVKAWVRAWTCRAGSKQVPGSRFPSNPGSTSQAPAEGWAHCSPPQGKAWLRNRNRFPTQNWWLWWLLKQGQVEGFGASEEKESHSNSWDAGLLDASWG